MFTKCQFCRGSPIGVTSLVKIIKNKARMNKTNQYKINKFTI